MFYDYTIAPLVLMLEAILSLLHLAVGSYGIAITLLAIVSKIILAPLTKIASSGTLQELEITSVLAPQIESKLERREQ